MSALSDADGNVLHIIPGQGFEYYEKPEFKILTNFSPYKQDSEQHPWMGWDRYHKAEAMLKEAADDFASSISGEGSVNTAYNPSDSVTSIISSWIRLV